MKGEGIFSSALQCAGNRDKFDEIETVVQEQRESVRGTGQVF